MEGINRKLLIVAVALLLISSILLNIQVDKKSQYYNYDYKDNVEGEWSAYYVKMYDSTGNFKEGPENNMPLELSLKSYVNGILKGSLNGVDFSGGVAGNIIRFAVDLPGGPFQAMGNMASPNVYNVSAVHYNGVSGVAESYKIIFVRNNEVPKMAENMPLNYSGNWILNKMESSNPKFSEISLNVAFQNASVGAGVMKCDNRSAGFCITVSYMTNADMYMGFMMDDDGNFWTVAVKKGVMVLFAAEATSGGVDSTRVELVRNVTEMNIFTPLLLKGITWKGSVGYDANAEPQGIDGYSLEIYEEGLNVFHGKITGPTTFEFTGFVSISSPPVMEVFLNVGGEEVHAMAFVEGDTFRIISISLDGKRLPEGLLVMEFVS